MIMFTSFILLMFFGIVEQQLNIYSFAVSISVLLFFIILLILKPKMILGGGDIKYMMLTALYLKPFLFPLFLLTTGLVQTGFLIYKQYYKKRRIAPMVPAMFSAVIITEILYFLGIYP